MSYPLLLSIVGQTATGKTQLALDLAQHFLANGYSQVNLLSADSKQVFQGLENLSGADIPADFNPAKNARSPYRYFQNADGSIALHGIACVAGEAEWSVAHFQKLFQALYVEHPSQTALIIVGGTGLYHQQLFAPAATLRIPPNQVLRKDLEKLSLDQLQHLLQTAWPERWQKMNHSDRLNYRRLVRAIEVSQAKQPLTTQSTNSTANPVKPLVQLGLHLPLKTLQLKIAERVEKRIEGGAMEEVKQFEIHQAGRALQAKTMIGYQEILRYLDGKLGLEELKKAWVLSEIQYAKRQQTWWKKQPGIQWLPADKIDFEVIKSYTTPTHNRAKAFSHL